jgi:hypothetical protein
MVGPRGDPAQGFRADVGGRTGRGRAGDAQPAIRRQTDPHAPEPARPPRPPRRSPRHPARGATPRGRNPAHRTQGAARPPPRSRRALRYLGVDVVYSRMLLRYLHAISHATRREWGHVHAFTFGTSLTNVTRALAQSRSRPRARRRRARGQRLGGRHAHRRVAGAVQQGVVAARADIRRDGDADHRRAGTRRSGLLDREAARLSRSVGRLVWLNPLSGWDGFSPQAGGVRTLWPMWTASTPAIRSTAFRRCPMRLGKRACATACWPRRVRRDSVFARGDWNRLISPPSNRLITSARFQGGNPAWI